MLQKINQKAFRNASKRVYAMVGLHRLQEENHIQVIRNVMNSPFLEDEERSILRERLRKLYDSLSSKTVSNLNDHIWREVLAEELGKLTHVKTKA